MSPLIACNILLASSRKYPARGKACCLVLFYNFVVIIFHGGPEHGLTFGSNVEGSCNHYSSMRIITNRGVLTARYGHSKLLKVDNFPERASRLTFP